MTMAPKIVVQKPSTRNPSPRASAISLVSQSIRALMHEQQQPERQDDERQREQLDDRRDERVDEAEDEGDAEQRQDLLGRVGAGDLDVRRRARRPHRGRAR